MLTFLIAATALLAEGKYGAFSPSAANVQAAPSAESPVEALKQTLLEHATPFEACAGTLEMKILRWRYQAIGGSIETLLDLDKDGKPTKETRILRPLLANAKANQCILAVIHGITFKPHAWKHPLGLSVTVDTQCQAQDAGGEFIDVSCKGKYRGVYQVETQKK